MDEYIVQIQFSCVRCERTVRSQKNILIHIVVHVYDLGRM